MPEQSLPAEQSLSAEHVGGVRSSFRPSAGSGRGAMGQASLIFRDILTLMGEFETVLAAHLRVNGTDLDAMQHLIQSGPMSPTELAQKLGVSTAATTLVVDRLEKVGHVTRQAHPSDRRSVRIVPNESSVAATFDALRPLILGVDDVLADFTPDERVAIEKYLGRVAGVYRTVIAATP